MNLNEFSKSIQYLINLSNYTKLSHLIKWIILVAKLINEWVK